MSSRLQATGLVLLSLVLVLVAPAPTALAATINVGCSVNELMTALNTANFEFNYAFNGGGINNYDNATLNVTRTTFHDNYANHGAGIANFGTAVISASVFDDNLADTQDPDSASFGGGILNSGTMDIAETTLQKNRARIGGGISNHGLLNLVRSTITNNTSRIGAGIANRASLTLANSTLTQNYAVKRGGGIFNNKKGTAQLVNVTLAQNISKKGGNVGTKGTFKTANTIFTQGTPRNCFGTVSCGDGNLRFPFSDNSCIGDFGNPRLGDLADNGGLTKTMALLPGSAAIGQGKQNKCNTAPVNGIDQRGETRAAPCDSGAYETE